MFSDDFRPYRQSGSPITEASTSKPAPRRHPLHRAALGVLAASASTFLLLLSVFLFSPSFTEDQSSSSASILPVPMGIGSHIVSNAVPMAQRETLFVQHCLDSQAQSEQESGQSESSPLVSPEAGTAMNTAEAPANSSVIADDETPMSFSPNAGKSSETPATNEEHSDSDTTNKQARSAVSNSESTSSTSTGMSPRTLSIGGSVISYVDTPEAAAAPADNAGLWLGDDSTTDGSWGFFIGHNPGDFSPVMDLRIGDNVRVCDASGDERSYTVIFSNRLASTTNWYDIDDQYTCYGESVILQTCWGDGETNKVVMAVAEK